MLEKALGIMASSRVSVAINVSPLTVDISGENLIEAIRNAGSLAKSLIVEITEVRPVVMLDRMRAFVAKLKALGVGVALDDYGAKEGYVDRRLVLELCPDYLKIDGYVINEAVAGKRSELKEAVRLADEVGAVVVGEHIDSAAKLLLLHSCGIRYGQGWLFGRAVVYPQWCEATLANGTCLSSALVAEGSVVNGRP
jgi:EAL domain-containing protein (putative c-di-GMP-specific phosphodiesterase class I)